MGLLDNLKKQVAETASGLGLDNIVSNVVRPGDAVSQQTQTTPPPPAQAQQPAPSGNAQIYNPMLENLIEMALADGELT